MLEVTLYTHGSAVQYKVGGEHYLTQGGVSGVGGVEYVPVSGYEGGLLVESYAAPAQPWPAHNLLPIDDGFDPGERTCITLFRCTLQSDTDFIYILYAI